jgi:hypothetical protein
VVNLTLAHIAAILSLKAIISDFSDLFYGFLHRGYRLNSFISSIKGACHL